MLRWQVLTWLIACAMVPLFVMALQGYHCARNAVLGLEATHLRSVLEAREARITDWFEERKADIKAVSGYPCTWEGCVGPSRLVSREGTEGYCHLLDHVRTGNPAFESIAAYDASWRRVAAVRDIVHDDSELAPSGFRAQLQDATDVAVSPPHTRDGW